MLSNRFDRLPTGKLLHFSFLPKFGDANESILFALLLMLFYMSLRVESSGDRCQMIYLTGRWCTIIFANGH